MSVAAPLLHDHLVESAARLPGKVALVCGGRRLTYGEVEARSNALAWALARRGVSRGDRVVVFADNTVEAAIAVWGALKADAVASVVNPTTKADKLAYLLNDCRAAALVTEQRLEEVLLDAVPRSPHLRCVIVAGELDPRRLGPLPGLAGWDEALADGPSDRAPPRRNIDADLAALIYTSGTTGDAKGVMLTHRNMLAASASITAYLGIVEDDVLLCALPLAFDYGLYQMILAFRAGARLVLERSFAFPAQVLAVVVAERVTGFPGVPTMFAMLAEMRSARSTDLSAVRFVTNTAAALPAKHVDAIREVFPRARIFSMFGLTECKRCTYLPPEDLDRKPGSVGIAIPNTEIWLEGDDGRRVGPGEVGQLVVRGATVMRGYWEKPAETARALRPGPIPGESVLHTGDWCRLDEEGYLYFVGRADDVIKSRGEKVAPKEIENVLVDIPGVREAAVVGVPDEILGQAVKAFVVLERGAALDERDVLRECHHRLENHLVPKHVVFVPDLPKTPSGKVTKVGLS